MPNKRSFPPPDADDPEESPAISDAPRDAVNNDDALRRRPQQSRGQRRVELLLTAAAEVIAEGGIEAATAEAIAARAKTAKGSFYQFFPNRDAVLAALALRYTDELRRIHERAFPLDAHALPLDRLIDRIIKPLAEFHDRNPAFRHVFITQDVGGDDTRGAPGRLRTQLFDSFVDRLDVLFAARNPRLPARDRRRVALVSATIGQAILARRARAAAADKKPLLDEARAVLLLYLRGALGAETRARRRPDI